MLNKQLRLLSLCRPSKLLCFYFASRKLSESAQKALWAQAIIKKIQTAEAPGDINSPSLRDQVISIEPNKTDDSNYDFTFDPNSKSAVMSLFQGEFMLNPNVYKQQRVTSGAQGQMKQSLPFLFCPNYLVTQQVFKIMRLRRARHLITGSFGISKTISVILYIQLSNFVNQYLFQAATDKEKKQELKELERLRYFETSIPKYYYWSLPLKRQLQESQFRAMILEQATQLGPQAKQALSKCSSLKDFFKLLKKYYEQKSIAVNVVCDQINLLASYMRKWNNFSTKNQQEDEKKQLEDEQDQKTVLQYKQRAIILRDWLHSFILLSSTQQIIFNSPATIEKELFEINDNKNTFTLQLDHHDRTIVDYIDFNSNIFEDWGKVDFFWQFWFQLVRNFLMNTPAGEITKIKEAFKTGFQAESSYFTRFLYASKFIKQLKKQKGFSLATANFAKIHQEFKRFCKEEYKETIKRFYEKQQWSKKLMLTFLYQAARKQILQCKKSEKPIPKYFIVERSTLQKNCLADQYVKIEQYFEGNKYKQVLPFVSEGNNLKFPWSSQQFIDLTHNTLYDYDIQLLSAQTLQQFQQVPASRGLDLKAKLIKALQKQTQLIFFPTIQDGNNVHLTFKIAQNTQFMPFNLSVPMNYISVSKKGKEQRKINISSLSKNLKGVISLCQQNLGKCMMAVPSYKGQRFNESEIIDFLLCQYEQAKLHPMNFQQFFIYSFQVSAENDLSKKQAEAIKFWNQKIRVSRSSLHRYKVYVYHIFVCSQAAIPKSAKRSKDSLPNLNILYVNWNNILFTETKEIKQKVSSFKCARRICSRGNL